MYLGHNETEHVADSMNASEFFPTSEVHVWTIWLKAPVEVSRAYRALLLPEETARADQFAADHLKRYRHSPAPQKQDQTGRNVNSEMTAKNSPSLIRLTGSPVAKRYSSNPVTVSLSPKVRTDSKPVPALLT